MHPSDNYEINYNFKVKILTIFFINAHVDLNEKGIRKYNFKEKEFHITIISNKDRLLSYKIKY